MKPMLLYNQNEGLVSSVGIGCERLGRKDMREFQELQTGNRECHS